MTKRTGLWTRLIALAVGVILLAGGHLGEVPAPAVFAAAPPCGVTWRDVPDANLWPYGSAFKGLAATGPNDVWLVGERTSGHTGASLTEHWDGIEWRQVPVPSLATNRASTLTAVAALSPNNAWAVGTSLTDRSAGAGAVQSETLIVHWDGDQWSLIPSPNDTGDDVRNSLSGIAATSPTDIWAVGGVAHWVTPTGEARILHWDGTRWSVVPTGDLGANTTLHSVAALRPDDAWAVGSIGVMGVETPFIVHWDGHSWSKRLDAGDQGYLLSVAAVRPDDAWAVGTKLSGDLLQRQGIIRHWDGHTWQAATNPIAAVPVNELFAVAATAPDDVWAVGDLDEMKNNSSPQPALLHWDGGRWTALPQGDPHGTATYQFATIGAVGPDDVWAAGTSLIRHYAAPCTAPPPPIRPYDPVPDPHDPAITYFPPVQHTLRGRFRAYWQAHGGLAQFGYPRTEEFQETRSSDGRTYTVQYFERNRFEYHPELAGTPFEVQLGLLGSQVTAASRAAGEVYFARIPDPAKPLDQLLYFPQTGHTLRDPLRRYWEAHGGLDAYGYPISEPFQEVNSTDGKPYIVQYFERNRFEYHPEYAGSPYEILLGLLGNDLLKQKGWQ